MSEIYIYTYIYHTYGIPASGTGFASFFTITVYTLGVAPRVPVANTGFFSEQNPPLKNVIIPVDWYWWGHAWSHPIYIYIYINFITLSTLVNWVVHKHASCRNPAGLLDLTMDWSWVVYYFQTYPPQEFPFLRGDHGITNQQTNKLTTTNRPLRYWMIYVIINDNRWDHQRDVTQ